MFYIECFIKFIFFNSIVLFIPPLLLLQAAKIVSIKYYQFSFWIKSKAKLFSLLHHEEQV